MSPVEAVYEAVHPDEKRGGVTFPEFIRFICQDTDFRLLSQEQAQQAVLEWHALEDPGNLPRQPGQIPKDYSAFFPDTDSVRSLATTAPVNVSQFAPKSPGLAGEWNDFFQPPTAAAPAQPGGPLGDDSTRMLAYALSDLASATREKKSKE